MGKGLGRAGREKRENRVGAGERQSSGDSGKPLPGIPDELTVYVNTTLSIIGFRHTESSKHEHVEHE